jgi:hypothetical protein
VAPARWLALAGWLALLHGWLAGLLAGGPLARTIVYRDTIETSTLL